MADDAENDVDADDLEAALDDEELPKRKTSGKKLILLILPIVLILGGGGAAYMLGMLDGLLGKDTAEEEVAEVVEEEPKGPGTIYDMPDLLVNLNHVGRQPRFLKISVSLELEGGAETIPEIERVIPRITDQFTVYLRELRLEDLRGSAGVYRLREELLNRVTAAAHPVEVRDVLFREMLVQ